MKKMLIIISAMLIGAMIISTVYVGQANAGPANPRPRTIKQPDGTEITLVPQGDEFNNWIETPDGYTVDKNPSTGVWEYAIEDAEGNLVPSGIGVYPDKTPPKDIPRHLIPKSDPQRRKEFNEMLKKSHEKLMKKQEQENKEISE